MTGRKLPHRVVDGFELGVRDEVDRLELESRRVAAMAWNDQIRLLGEDDRQRVLGLVESFISRLASHISDLRLPEILPGIPRDFAATLLSKSLDDLAGIDWWHYARHAFRIGCIQLSTSLARVASCRCDLDRDKAWSEVAIAAASIVDGRDYSELSKRSQPSIYEVRLGEYPAALSRGGIAIFGLHPGGSLRPIALNPSNAALLAAASSEDDFRVEFEAEH
jgi:rhodanese-related sulfurtransferase